MAWLECFHAQRGSHLSIRLHKALTTLGRVRGNDVVLDDPQIAETAAVFVRKDGRWNISAQGKGATVSVNGQLTGSSTLHIGDTLCFGGWRVVLRDGEPTSRVTVPNAPDLSQLERLVDLSADMLRDPRPDKLFPALLQTLVGLTHAEKGFVIVFRDGERQIVARHNIDPEKINPGMSDSIVDRVVQTREALIVSDAVDDTRFGHAKSVVDLRLSSVMCVPLSYQDDLLGVLYFGNDAVSDLFTDDDLTILRIYASQASLIVYHALLLEDLRIDNASLREQLGKTEGGVIVGQSAPMRKVFSVLHKVAPTDLSVLILGETGTGKELAARELHAQSHRAQGPFIAINCGAIPETLLESELFGHRKGAFTGADADKLGKIEAAHQGTLFLDEIGEMPAHLQVKLLRVLQERMIERVGDVKPRPIDVRVLSATHRDPLEMISQGTFREDLYYRLAEITLTLPPLRERGEDIALIAGLILKRSKERYGGRARGFTNAALAALMQQPWPGNVRQLENVIKKAVIMSDRALLNEEDLGFAAASKRAFLPLNEAAEQFKADYIRSTLELCSGNKAATARALGVDARTIFRYLNAEES